MTLTIDIIPEGSDARSAAFTAAEYYGGQFTALYALASSGSLELYKGEGLGRIIRELREAVKVAEAEYPEDIEDLQALLQWCETNE
jgi:hypothetical protein